MDYFTDMQLQAWGWSVDFLRREIAAGRLHATMQGAGFAIRRDDWDAWVQRYNPAKTHGTAAEAASGTTRTVRRITDDNARMTTYG